MKTEKTISSYRWIILLIIWIISFFISGNWLFIISIIDEIRFGIFSFGLTTGEGALIVVLSFVGIIPVSFLSGPFIDKLGVKKIGIIGNLIVGIFAILRGLSDTFLTLSIFTIFMGVGVGFTISLASKLIGYWFKENEIGTANGISIMANGFGIFLFEAITLPLILPLVGHWRNIFFFYGFLVLIALIFWIIFIKDYPGEQSSRIAIERAPIREALSYIIKSREVWYVVVIQIATSLSYFVGKNAFRLLFPLKTGEGSIVCKLFGQPQIAMFLISFISLGAMTANLIIPFLSDRFKKRKIFLASALIMTSFSIILSDIFSGILLWVFAFIVGFSVGINFPLTPTCIIELVDAKYIGTGVGLINSMGYSSVLALTIIFPLLIPDKSDPISYLPLLIALAIICLITVNYVNKLPETAGKMKMVY